MQVYAGDVTGKLGHFRSPLAQALLGPGLGIIPYGLVLLVGDFLLGGGTYGWLTSPPANV